MSSLFFRAIILGLALPAASTAMAELPVFDNNETPVFLNYEPNGNRKATSCELYVNGFGDGSESSAHSIGGNLYENWIRIWGEEIEKVRSGKLLNTGAFFNYTEQTTENPSPVQKEVLVIGAPTPNEPYYFRVDFRYKWHNAERETSRTINRFAYFADIQNSDQTITRYWLTNGARDFTIPEVTDGHPRTGWISVGPGFRSMRYIEQYSSSPIFDQRKACYRRY
jgi:hypothetical protein